MVAGEPGINWWMHGSETVLGWDDLRFPATAINPVGQTDAAALDTTVTNFPGTLLFSNTADNLVCGIAQLPHETYMEADGVLKPHIHWAKTSSASGAVVWEFTYRWIGNVGSVAEDWTSADNGTLAVPHSDTANKHALTAFTFIPLTGRRPSAMLAFRLYRRAGTDEADTYGAAARLFEVDFHYQRLANRPGTLQEYPDVD